MVESAALACLRRSLIIHVMESTKVLGANISSLKPPRLPSSVPCSNGSFAMHRESIYHVPESHGIIKGFGEIFELDAFLCRSLQ